MEDILNPNVAIDVNKAAPNENAKTNAEISKDYYSVATDFYLQGWGRMFHFGARKKGQTLEESLLYNETYLADRLGLKEGENCLDIGCGVAGPMMHIAAQYKANITGINNLGYQLGKAKKYVADARLEKYCTFVECDWMQIPLPDESYDKAYEIEATCHAADNRTGVFSEINRLLKPGGLFGGYEWVMTDNFNPNDPIHLDIKRKIEIGDGISNLNSPGDVRIALENSGFEILEFHDLAKQCDPETPWYLPFTGFGLRSMVTTPVGRFLVRNTLRFLEALRIVPKGTLEIQKMLEQGAQGLMMGGKKGIFTPMFFFLAKKVRKVK